MRNKASLLKSVIALKDKCPLTAEDVRQLRLEINAIESLPDGQDLKPRLKICVDEKGIHCHIKIVDFETKPIYSQKRLSEILAEFEQQGLIDKPDVNRLAQDSRDTELPFEKTDWEKQQDIFSQALESFYNTLYQREKQE